MRLLSHAAILALACLLAGQAAAQKPNSDASKAAAGQAVANPRVKIGVTDSAWDDIGSVLRAINFDYQLTAGSTAPLNEFNCVFVGCGTTESGKFPAQEVRGFVQRGGVLYVSDLAYPVVQSAFPEFVREFQQSGMVGVFDCVVLDKKLAKEVAPQIQLNFDAGGWASPTQVSNNVQVLVAMQQGSARVPVLITFQFGRGRVVYTSFHNHANANELEQKLIRALVAAPVAAARQIQGEFSAGTDLDELKKRARQNNANNKPPMKLTARSAEALSVEELLAALEESDAAGQEIVLGQLHDRKGGEATLALGKAVARVDAELKPKARELLVKRMSRLTARSLAGYIAADVEMEVRVAAAKAAAGKDDPELTGQLVAALQDVNERELADAAHEALAATTSENFGPFVGASIDQRFVTARKWKKWWEAAPR